MILLCCIWHCGMILWFGIQGGGIYWQSAFMIWHYVAFGTESNLTLSHFAGSCHLIKCNDVSFTFGTMSHCGMMVWFGAVSNLALQEEALKLNFLVCSFRWPKSRCEYDDFYGRILMCQNLLFIWYPSKKMGPCLPARNQNNALRIIFIPCS